ncbi:hypothetical protein Acor_83050 [Acrocarpospora corrugata]|uniref:Uncharacterized protein n=1 Tax=Acrocarpospora corrugata TaxID=35763 RepID=A0A5M3WBN3_9ACTN|nr:hypothetical protein Acor_83050 [Acrocarpospora corrugata]
MPPACTKSNTATGQATRMRLSGGRSRNARSCGLLLALAGKAGYFDSDKVKVVV